MNCLNPVSIGTITATLQPHLQYTAKPYRGWAGTQRGAHGQEGKGPHAHVQPHGNTVGVRVRKRVQVRNCHFAALQCDASDCVMLVQVRTVNER